MRNHNLPIENTQQVHYQTVINKQINCWICQKEVKDKELLFAYLEKNLLNFCHQACWKDPEKHGWMY